MPYLGAMPTPERGHAKRQRDARSKHAGPQNPLICNLTSRVYAGSWAIHMPTFGRGHGTRTTPLLAAHVFPNRIENVDGAGGSIAGDDAVRNATGDSPNLPRRHLIRPAADAKFELAFHQITDLLVGMAVLGNDGVGFDINHGEGHRLCFRGVHPDPGDRIFVVALAHVDYMFTHAGVFLVVWGDVDR